MRAYFHRLPAFLSSLFPGILWHGNREQDYIYLTFDDGPTPNVTDQVLLILEKHQACATFFVLGENAKHAKGDQLIQKILDKGHGIASHGHQHLNGWKTSNSTYIDNTHFEKRDAEHILDSRRAFFRPPYGRLTWLQYSILKKRLKIVIWSVMSGDFDATLSKEKCLSRLIKRTKRGDVIVFHDNEKSWNTLSFVLPRYLKYCEESGFKFGLIKDII